jgi:DNA helicase II / ATP-dependent DNA helicase PcrA
MRFYADLHVHSRYSRATSPECDLEHFGLWARRKGITVVATGDVSHPAWLAELGEKLVPAEPGLFRLREDLERPVEREAPPSCRGPVRYVLSGEISTIYKKGERTRKIHHCVYFPDLASATRFGRKLGALGNVTSDGRPILGLDSRDLLEITLAAGAGAYLVPAHIWTPWFAVLGSKSGFDSIAECYGDLHEHIFAAETGLSSDPPMNWRVSALDRYRLVSNSDAHSPPMLGREACVFDTDLDYFAMRRALETGAGHGGTVEFFPEEGKYHLDGHRACGTRLEPAETRRAGGACPACGKPVTVGVMHRVELLADRAAGTRPAHAAGFRSLVPLAEIVGEIRGVGAKSQSVAAEVARLVEHLGPELGILSDLPLAMLKREGSSLLVEAMQRLRRGQVVAEAGYDGEYGVVRLFRPEELKREATVGLLFPLPACDPRSPSSPPPAHSALTSSPPSPSAPEPPAPQRRTDASASGVRPRTGGATATSRLLAALDEDQRRAAEITDGPLLIVAGPGTGKTRALTHRLAHLIAARGTRPEQCLAVTFTRRAADELTERLGTLVPHAAPRVTVTTFHGLGHRLLRAHGEALGLPPGFAVADEARRLAILGEVAGLGARKARVLLPEVSRLKRATAGAAPAPAAGTPAAAARRCFERYQEALREQALVDFDDLVALPVALLERDPALAARLRSEHPVVSIDEYQDIDEVQYRLVRLLCPPDGNLCAVGDPDQAIYGFRGADVGFFLRFREDYPTARTVQLTRNYRSSPTIVTGALQAIAPGSLVPGRVLEAVLDQVPERIVIHEARNERAEADYVAHVIEQLVGGSSFLSFDSKRVAVTQKAKASFADFAVLCRTSAQGEPIAEALDRAGVPHQRRSHDRLADRPGVRELLALLPPAPAGAALVSVADRLRAALREGLEAAGDDQARLAEAREAAELLGPLAARCGDDVPGFLATIALGAEVDTLDPRAERVALLTLHAAKGLEFPVVFIVGCEEGLLPFSFGPAPLPEAVVAEERRLFFVGMTRARAHLYLTRAGRRTRHGKARDTVASPFLRDLEESLVERVRASAPPPTKGTAPRSTQLKLL